MQIIGNYYHIYNRGAHKAPIFLDISDYSRFTALLYLGNDTASLVYKSKKGDVFSQPRKEPLVQIFAYCLMPNHFHLGLIEIRPRGIEQFIRKICTAYSMYYNKKYMHSGTIFQGKYKYKHVDTDRYLHTLLEYIHLNPFGIEEDAIMKEAKPEYYFNALNFSMKYEFSSFKDYLNEKRPQNSILCPRSDLGIGIIPTTVDIT